MDLFRNAELQSGVANYLEANRKSIRKGLTGAQLGHPPTQRYIRVEHLSAGSVGLGRIILREWRRQGPEYRKPFLYTVRTKEACYFLPHDVTDLPPPNSYFAKVEARSGDDMLLYSRIQAAMYNLSAPEQTSAEANRLEAEIRQVLIGAGVTNFAMSQTVLAEKAR